MAKQRLAVMRKTSNGFIIAEKDLQLRGPGELLGTRQTGLPQLRLADLQRDQELIPRAQELAKILLNAFPKNAAALIKRWLGDSEIFARA